MFCYMHQTRPTVEALLSPQRWPSGSEPGLPLSRGLGQVLGGLPRGRTSEDGGWQVDAGVVLHWYIPKQWYGYGLKTLS